MLGGITRPYRASVERVSILYLRCPKTYALILAGNVYYRFNSLFEMHGVCLRGCCRHAKGFNSLFEMLAAGRGVASWAETLGFNSLFEMQEKAQEAADFACRYLEFQFSI